MSYFKGTWIDLELLPHDDYDSKISTYSSGFSNRRIGDIVFRSWQYFLIVTHPSEIVCFTSFRGQLFIISNSISLETFFKWKFSVWIIVFWLMHLCRTSKMDHDRWPICNSHSFSAAANESCQGRIKGGEENFSPFFWFTLVMRAPTNVTKKPMALLLTMDIIRNFKPKVQHFKFSDHPKILKKKRNTAVAPRPRF